MRKFEVFCLIGFFLMIGIVGAMDFDVGNSSFVYKDYLDGDVIMGTLNMSFDKQENLDFTNNLGDHEKKLLDVFNSSGLTAGEDYSCEPLNCISRYQTVGSGGQSKDISIGKEKELYGFRIKEDDPIDSIKGLTFNVDVNGGLSCVNQIFIDLFDDGTIDFYNPTPHKGAGDCGSSFYPGKKMNRGCFDEDDPSVEETPIGDELYCEYMKDIPPSAAYEIGGYISSYKQGGSIGFALYPTKGGCSELDYCEVINVQNGLRNAPLSGTGVMGYSSIEKFDALVCVYTTSGSDYFKIRTNDKEDSCGFSMENCDYVSEDDFNADFDLFIRPKGYGVIGNVIFDKDLYEETTGENLKDDLNEYLDSTYGKDCSGSNGCVIPFAIWGVEGYNDQKIHLAKLSYKTTYLGEERKIYRVKEYPARVSSDYLEIDVEDIDIEVPDENGKHTFKLFLGGDEIIREAINVDIGFSFELLPRFAFIGRESSFSVKPNTDVISTTWDFGDDSTPFTVQGASAKHMYGSAGEYKIKVMLVKKVGSGSKNSTRRFSVIVGEARESAEITIKDLEARIALLESEIASYPAWMQDSFKETISIGPIKTVVQGARADFGLLSENSPDSSYIAIINELLKIDLPYSVYVSSMGTLPAFLSYDSVNVAHIEEITISSIDDVELFKANMIAWMEEHYDVAVSFETMAADMGDQDVDLFKKYVVSITEKKSPGDDNAYLILGYPKSTFVFSGTQGDAFSETNIGGGIFVDIATTPIRGVEFLILGSDAPNVANLGVYVSPAPRVLGVTSSEQIMECWHMNCDEGGNFLWKRFLIWMSVLLLVFLTFYILLQTWYKRHYEHYLFPNPNDLYNLLNFIYNSRRDSLRDPNIRKSLNQRKWNGEQITYAFKKLEGKRTGMWEIPLFKFVENMRVRRELKKKQKGRPLDTRFIKQSNL